jgi:hypothetical protein
LGYGEFEVEFPASADRDLDLPNAYEGGEDEYDAELNVLALETGK